MDKYEEAAEKLFAYLMDDDKVYSERAIAAALRESAAEAFEEARERAQIEVNACEHHAKAMRNGRTLHIAAWNVAGVILNFCSARITELRRPTPRSGREE